MTTDIETYFLDGCGRCALGGTPECKINTWREPLKYLRNIILDCGLTEEMKWGSPCYSYQGKNVLILGAFNEFCVLTFFKGSLLKDNLNLLEKQGENVQGGLIFRITDINRVVENEDHIRSYIFEAIEVEKVGLQVKYKDVSEYEVPQELLEVWEKDSEFKEAFEALTPGRQKGYLLHFSQPKQSKTRFSRIEKWKPAIMEGIGMHDRYKS